MCEAKYLNLIGTFYKIFSKTIFNAKYLKNLFISIEMSFSVNCNFVVVIPG